SFRFCRTEKEILSALKKMEEERDLKDYDIDGAVIKVDSISDQEKLGHTARSPRWAVAFKFRAKSAVTQLLQVSYNVGRTGVITPRATLKPVTVGGVTISSATLHNYDQIERLGVGIGDLVRIERGGDVIPKILNLEKKSPNSKKILPPETCPSCGEPSFREPEGVYYRCNNISCPAQMIRRIIHFASQDAMNIEGLGESVAAQLYHANLVENISDIYQLEKTDLLGLELFKEKRASNLMESIRESQNISLDSFIFALGIPNIGRQTSKTLAKRFGNIHSLMQAAEDDLLSLEDAGEIVAATVREFFKSIKNREIIDKLIKYGVNPQYVAPQVGLLTGKRFVFTGILDKMKRKQAAALIETLGGKFSNALSRDTDFLVAGVGGGKKLVEAEKYGIRVISEEEFIEMTSSGEY
ncbi:MAG: NAD-dependent DNA ligase LigA, partial [Elusimicrobia bacterium]|nr:NAD-dependent DNA ligase LigA [Elusimicrobiota bacterium]